jgi:deazaflavin-dependent oxidoreductase (nitroreductase family)
MSMRRRLARAGKYANKVIAPVLSRMPGFCAVQHRGRKSGRAYSTPVKFFRIGDSDYLISLPYGPESDWVRNVVAAGGCRLRVHGRLIDVQNPRVFEDRTAGMVRQPFRFALSHLGVRDFLQLTPVGADG